MEKELHVLEEGTYLFWGLIILVCTAVGTYLLTGSFVSMDWDPFKVKQIGALLLFLISFRGIYKLSEPLYHLTLYFEAEQLFIRIHKGIKEIDTLIIPVDKIESLQFTPHYPRSSNEALFDFSRNYHLMWKRKGESEYHKLLGVEYSAITLKVDDIASIMRFITERNTEIIIPEAQASYFNL